MCVIIPLIISRLRCVPSRLLKVLTALMSIDGMVPTGSGAHRTIPTSLYHLRSIP